MNKMENFKNSFQQKLENRLQFIIGFTQFCLMKENNFLWTLSLIVSVLQKVAIIKLATLLNNFNGLPGIQDLELLFKICVPTMYLPENLGPDYLIACQSVFIVFFSIPAILVGVSMSDEITFFKQTKFKNKRQLNISQSDNLSDCIQIMHQIYNQNSYIEGFQHRLMSDQSNTSLQIIRLRQIAIFLNYFPHVFLIPILYFLLQINLALDKADQTQQIVGQILNVILAIETLIIAALSLVWCQVSFTLHESNFLRLRFSYLQWLHIGFCIIPILISYSYVRAGNLIKEDDFIHIVNLVFVILAFLIDALDAYITLPYVQKFKYSTNLFMRAIVICLTLFFICRLSDQQIICLTFIVSPCLSRLFVVLQDSRIENVLTSTLKKEKSIQVLVNQQQPQQTLHTHESEQGLRIESENIKYKDFQSNMIKQYDMSYFIHFIRAVQLMRLSEIGVLTRNSGVELKNERSKILMVCIILLRTHTENCNNQYCFCRGLKGEKRKIIEKYEIVKEMRMYDDFKILNIQFYVELIMRYLRDYSKLVFQTEIRKAHPNIIYLIQILVFLCNSDECYQAQLQILDLKHLLEKGSSLQQRLAFELLKSYSKYQILHRFKEDITRQSIELTLKYEDYRYTELERDRLLKLVFANLQHKKQFLIKLNDETHSYESLEELYLQLNTQNCNIQKELEYFNLYSPGRTSLYCYMLYCLEVTNNYDQFIKLCNLINTRESKFFEYPSFYYKTEEQSYKVGYMLLNLTQSHMKRGEIISFSKNFPSFVGYTQEEFRQQVKSLDQLCYPSLIKAHDEMVEMFVITNRPMIFRQPLPLLTQQSTPGVLSYLEIFIDISFNFSSNILPSFCFMKEIKQGIRQDGLSGFILLDSKQNIEGITNNALECFEMSNPSKLLGKSINQFIPNFNSLDAQLQHYLEEYQKENGVSGTLTTANKLVQHFTVSQDSIEMILDKETKFQLDLEVQMSYSLVNRMVFKVYVLKIRSPYKLGAVCSDESPLSKSLDEYSSEFEGIKLKDYIMPGAGDNEIPQFTSQPDPITLRSQMVPVEQENQPLKQQEFLCSDHHDMISKQDSSEKDIESPEQPHKQIYINSISSNSSKQSEIQRILVKSHFYRKFSEMNTKPKLLYALLFINVFSLAAILGFTTASTILYANWQSNMRSNIYILQAFTMTAYSRATLQGSMTMIQYIQFDYNLSQYGMYYEYNATLLGQLQTVLDRNIEIFSTKMDEYSENSIIREVFSTIELEQLDIFENVDKTVKGWTALFQLIYMIRSLHISDFTDSFQFLKSILYLLRSYSKYKDAYSLLNTRFTDEINSILGSQDNIIDYVTFIFIAVYVVYFCIAFLLQFSYIQLCKKYIRCSEQISHSAIASELNHVNQLLLINQDHFDLYEYHFSLRDKFHSEEEEKQNNNFLGGTSNANNSNNNNNNKKFIKVQGQLNLKRQFTFSIHLISFTITLITLLLIRMNDKSQIQDLESKLAIYQKCITFTESLSEACLTNFILQSNKYLVESAFIDPEDPAQFFIYTNESYTIANSILGEILYSEGTVSEELKILFSSNVCLVVNEPDICVTVNNGELEQGLLLPSQELFQILRENIDLYQISGSASQMLQLNHMLSESFMIDAVNNFVDTVRQTVEQGILDSNNVKLTISIIFYLFIILINLAQIWFIHQYVTKKLWGIRQFVYLLPPKALYNEDSFYKTLTYLLKIENQILYM
ncbi:unnamed protein product [Paramecium octaurelia]|uniref:PAS domain-containing protein n=1 Tax=Paramecium octaurelia TaxID=43137 RepID=A0A8S1SGR6_PAROT|nr:unnamed protein product [Paramecium octaurelia]